MRLLKYCLTLKSFRLFLVFSEMEKVRYVPLVGRLLQLKSAVGAQERSRGWSEAKPTGKQNQKDRAA